MWTIEAFEKDGDDLVWEVDLTDVPGHVIAERLGLHLPAPGVIPLDVDQARSLLGDVPHLDAQDSLHHADHLAFFLAEYASEP